ncbi:MAG: ribosome silencing factor [bacterium]
MKPSTTSPASAPASSITLTEARDVAIRARNLILDKKGRNTIIFDLRGESSITDYMIIASGVTPPQLKAMANELKRGLKENSVSLYRQSGQPDDGWVVMDYVDVVVHLFLDEVRTYYAIEELWSTLPVVE